MNCPNCNKRMRQVNRYRFSGFKHGVPGERLSYYCRQCGLKKHLLLIGEEDFEKLKGMLHDYKMASHKAKWEAQEKLGPLAFNRILKRGHDLQKELEKFLKRIEKYW